jgi:hypothetical protein
MNQHSKGQGVFSGGNSGKPKSGKSSSGIIPNPKLKLLDQVREVMRLLHYAISTERSYCDWIRRFIRFHRMQSRDELLSEPRTRIERFLSHLAVEGQVSASTQGWGSRLFIFHLTLCPFDQLPDRRVVRVSRNVSRRSLPRAVM